MTKISRPEIMSVIQEIVRDNLRLNMAEVSENLFDHLDSIQKISLAVALEDHFKVALPLHEGAIATLDDLVLALERGSHAAAKG